MGETISEAGIAVPAYFNDEQRQATKHVGRLAGLEVKPIVNEPTEASLGHGLETKQNVDEGTFDVSILEVGDGAFLGFIYIR